MIHMPVIATALALAMAGGEGGKIAWSKKEPAKAMAEAKNRQMGMMLYFTSEG